MLKNYNKMNKNNSRGSIADSYEKHKKSVKFINETVNKEFEK